MPKKQHDNQCKLESKRRVTILLLIAMLAIVVFAIWLGSSTEGDARKAVPQVLVTKVEFQTGASNPTGFSSPAIKVRLSDSLPQHILPAKGRHIRYIFLDGYTENAGKLSVTLFVPKQLLFKTEAQRVQLLSYSLKSWSSTQTSLVKTTSEGYTFKAFPPQAEAYALVVKDEVKRTR